MRGVTYQWNSLPRECDAVGRSLVGNQRKYRAKEPRDSIHRQASTVACKPC